jgi:hypothetical protein
MFLLSLELKKSEQETSMKLAVSRAMFTAACWRRYAAPKRPLTKRGYIAEDISLRFHFCKNLKY